VAMQWNAPALCTWLTTDTAVRSLLAQWYPLVVAILGLARARTRLSRQGC
jgi:hypothetical protein